MAVAGARLAVQLHAQDCSAPADAESLTVALRQLSLVEMHLKNSSTLGKTIELQRGPCKLEAIVGETIELLGPQCRHAHTELRAIPAETTIDLNADAAQLSHLFLNVIMNAVEAAGPNG